ncbi:type III restriction-modification system endonuclease [Ileibacterium valens]|uniref:type III restriction-modification system endonuclease n=1 Tax=Ileibacterium valens TaxID=1862668 RepID=UPI00272C9F48|nr:DEAD/DEAH box helicase family protein [Ileibacterium valens]
MKIKYKRQKFQADAAKAVVDVFKDQPYTTPSYMIDQGKKDLTLFENLEGYDDSMGWNNAKIIPSLSDKIILERINKIQREGQIKPSEKLIDRSNGYNLSIEMETGVGKTYTYIKTMYELNKAYGWSKFIVVVPSIAIREGVYKSFQTTQDHFAEEYGKKIRFFVYNSSQLSEIDHFASDSSINIMIINAQAFNATGKDARRIYMELDEFRSRRPIDVIAKTNPILIIDEPQSVEGKKTKEKLKEFNPLMTLRYSATHKDPYNMIYRLDAIEAYNQRLVKKIAVKGISETGTTATNSFVYLEGVNVSKKNPTATIQFDVKMKNGTKPKSRIVNEGDNLFEYSGGLEEYRDGFVVKRIDGRDNHIEFLNGLTLYAGDVVGKIDEDQLRRIQIRETILTHLEREQELFYKGIKVLSLFFIDEVDHYRIYNKAGEAENGKFAEMFEEEYDIAVSALREQLDDQDEYAKYLNAITASQTHSGYFSIDKKGHLSNGKINKREGVSEDTSAYDLIMKNKELLLDRDPKKSPVRFIFSHSALREGWDNPNVFQICTLKQSSSEIRKRQEVGRGLRLCVNDNGERMDANVLGDDVQNVNLLTVIASESYDSFAKGLQSEMAEDVSDRPRKVTTDLFANKIIRDVNGDEQVVTPNLARIIYNSLIRNDYIDDEGILTDKYYSDKKNGTVQMPDKLKDSQDSIIKIFDSIYDPRVMTPENGRSNNVTLKIDKSKLASTEFKNLWKQINQKTIYTVNFDSDELVEKSIASLDEHLQVAKVFFRIETGKMNRIEDREQLVTGNAFAKDQTRNIKISASASQNVKYDLVGKIVEDTGLTRKTIIRILQGIKPETFNQFKENPEDFIIKSSTLINDQKATAIIQHITYDLLDEAYDTDIFTDATIKGQLGKNAMKTQKHLFDHLIFDSDNEKKFASDLDTSDEVAVYVKLPNSFFISTPVGKYNPDWAIAFYEGNVKHIYFVAETKGSMNSLQLREVEKSKIECAREHFKAISGKNVVYDVVDNYQSLMDKVMK